MSQLARFFSWSPSDLGELTGDALEWWATQANLMLEKQG